MSSSAAVRMDRVSRGAPLITGLLFIAPLFTSASPRLSPFFLAVIGLTLIVAALRRGLPWRDLLKPDAALIALIAVALYAALSAVWAANPEGALSKSALLAAATLVVFAAHAAIATLDAQETGRAARAFVAGALCGTGFVAIELLTDGALTRFTMNQFQVFRPDGAKHLTIHNGRVTKMNLSEFNQHVAILALLLWPGLLALGAAFQGSNRVVATVLFFVALAVPIAISEHDSSQVGIIASLLVFALAWSWPRATIRGLAAMWCLGFVLVLPLDFLAFRADLHQAHWLPSSARARVIIWEYTAERVLERPWVGIGADSTPALKAKKDASEWPEGFVYKRTTGQHAHNLFLQVWYELGLAGAILAAVAGAAVVLRIPYLPAPAQAYGAASFALFAVIAAFAWGVWQIWLMCAFALLPLYLAMAAAPFRSNPPDSQGS